MSAGRKVITDNKNWGTPPKYVDAVKAFFDGQIDLDPLFQRVVGRQCEGRIPAPAARRLESELGFQKDFCKSSLRQRPASAASHRASSSTLMASRSSPPTAPSSAAASAPITRSPPRPRSAPSSASPTRPAHSAPSSRATTRSRRIEADNFLKQNDETRTISRAGRAFPSASALLRLAFQ